MTVSDGALSIAVAALQQIAQRGSQERDRVTAQAALNCIDALNDLPDGDEGERIDALYAAQRQARAVREQGGVMGAMELCGCESRCGDDGDTEGPGVCKGLPRQPDEPLVEIVLVPRWPSAVREQEA